MVDKSKQMRSARDSRLRPKTDRNHLIASVAGVFDVLECFARSARPLNFSQVLRETNKPKGSVHRILSTLVNIGVLTQSAVGEYSLTFKLWGLGSAAFAGMDLVKISQPYINDLMVATDETAALAILDGPECVTYLCKSESVRSIRVQFWVGKRVPSWRSATGRTLLAFNPEVARSLLDPTTAARIDVDVDELHRILSRTYKSGYAVTKGDNHPEMGGIAAAVRDHSGAVIGSCCVAVPRFRMSQSLVKRALPQVVRTAHAISEALGYVEIPRSRRNGVRPRPLIPIG